MFSLFFSFLSSDGEKEEGDDLLDLRRTESDSVLKKVCVLSSFFHTALFMDALYPCISSEKRMSQSVPDKQSQWLIPAVHISEISAEP